jgi:putative PIN family toxin of toxin-antitoxin system
VVIHPNVWVSALINPFGAPARVVDAVTGGDIVAVVTQHLLDELTAVLIRPKFRRWLSVADAVAFVETLGGYADLHPDPGGRALRVRDPDDDYLVALAEAAAAVIVTGEPTYWMPASTPQRSRPRTCWRESHENPLPGQAGGPWRSAAGPSQDPQHGPISQRSADSANRKASDGMRRRQCCSPLGTPSSIR